MTTESPLLDSITPSRGSESLHALWDSTDPVVTDVPSDLAWRRLGELSRTSVADPQGALRELEAMFVSGKASSELNGPADLRFVMPMLGRFANRVVRAADGDKVRASVAKVFDRGAGRGENWLSAPVHPILRLLTLPAPFRVTGGVARALPFDIHVSESLVFPGLDVLHITYQRKARNPFVMTYLTRDELVEIAPGVHLALAHVPTRGGRKVIGYFAVRSREVLG